VTREDRILSYKGKPPTPEMLIEVWTNAEKRFGGTNGRTDRIKKCRDLRRGTETVKIDATFLTNHPEVDRQSAISLLPEREGYERDLIARAGSVKPAVSREPLDVTDTARDDAEEYESYMREVAEDEESGVPFDTSIEKLAEDGEHGLVITPWDLDSDGIPDFYDRLTERARAALKAEDRKAYQKDDNRAGHYVRRDERGRRVVNPRFNRDAKGRTRKDAEKQDGKGSFKHDRAKSEQAHEEAVRRYLLAHRASNFRIIPALDCYPLLGRGYGKSKWSVEGVIERAAFSREDLLVRNYGWNQLGSKLVLPRGMDPRNSETDIGPYLYTLYTFLEDESDDECVRHPCILYCVGGAGTWWDGAELDKDGKKNAVAIIDLYAERKMRHRFWDYQFGAHTSDDDPNHYARPAAWPFRNRILNIEGIQTANHVSVQMNCYGGSYYKPDAALLREDPESVVDSQTHMVRQPTKPGPGEIQPWAGDVIPMNQAKIGEDAWKLEASYQESLQRSMAIDSIDNQESGHAMLVASSQGQTQKRHIREAGLRVYRFCLETDARWRSAAQKCYGVKWPILTSKERPVGHEQRKRQDVSEFNAEKWLGEDENVKLNVTYGEEFNLARAQMEMDAADRGYRALEHVAAAFGESDTMNLRVAVAKDQLWKTPEAQQMLGQMVAEMRGMKRQQQARAAQADGQMTKQGLPGAESGLPEAMLQRQGQQAAAPPGGGGQQGPGMGPSVVGGIKAGQMQGDRMQLAAQQQSGLGAA
jgi:hypothetical protein